jgi:Outer membrane protein/protective antigen OMA87
LSACVFAIPARAEDCAVIESRSSLAALSGARITSVEIVSEAPDLPGAARLLNVLHPVSQEGVIRRQLLFAAGDSVDTLLVGETMRRLRAQRLFSDAVILARRCDPSGDVGLLVRTRDTWTLRPTARLRAGNQLSVGVEDKNFLGSGRTIALTREVSFRGNGAAASFSDPFLLGTSTAASLRVANLAGAHAFRLGLHRHEYSVFDRWRIEGSVARLSYGDTVVKEKALHTINAMTMVGRQIAASENSVTHALVGVEFDSAASISPSTRRSSTSGMPHVRSFLGFDLGIMRRTAQFDSASWIVPGRGFLDVPMGWEGEAVVAAGEERDVRVGAFKYDFWTGRVWMPGRGRILMLDGWASAYLGRNIDRNQITRASLMYRAQAWRGMWGLRVTGEQLAELDPDRRGLSLMPLADYTSPMLGHLATRGGRSVAASMDRDLRVMRVGAASVLNAGGFFASSYRWDVSDPAVNQLAAGVIGTRLRILSANGTVGSIRLDVGFPVFRSAVLPSKPYVLISYGSLFDASRQRDGRRAY